MQQFDEVVARFIPADRGQVRAELLPFAGKVATFTAAWEIGPDDRPMYDGDWAMQTPPGWPVPWIELSSLEAVDPPALRR